METCYETAMDNFVKNSSTNKEIKANNIEMASLLKRMRVLSNETNILNDIADLEYQIQSFKFQCIKAELGDFYTRKFQTEILTYHPNKIKTLENKIKSLKDLLK